MDFHQVKAENIYALLQATTSSLAILYFKLLLHRQKASQNIWFFTTCLKFGLTPKYVKLRSDNTSVSAKKAIRSGVKRWLIEDRKREYNKRDVSSVYLNVVHTQLLARLSSIEFDILDSTVREDVQYFIHVKYLRQKAKIEQLKYKYRTIINEQSVFSNHVFYPRFINMSEVVFDKEQTQLIEKGFKYNMQPGNNKKEFELLGVDCDALLSNFGKYNKVPPSVTTSHKYLLADKIDKLMVNYESNKLANPSDNSLVKSIKKIIKDNNLIFTRADKGNTIIALHREQYTEKTEDFLRGFEKEDENPTTKYQTEVKNTIRNSSLFNDLDYYYLTQMNPQPPKLYSFIKLHKENNPIRPVVSFITAPSYKLSKRLINIIQRHSNFQPAFSIKNTSQLIDKIKNIKIPHNATLVSFDVKNLFPSVPPTEVLQITDNLLLYNKCNPQTHADIMNSFEVCLKQNYFQFDNKIYTCENGLAMGNPISPLAAEIFMDNLEISIKKHQYFKSFLFWYRYVDDVLACFVGTERQLNKFFIFINNLHPRIKFTLEIEEDNSINFLDLTIQKLDNFLSFSIYRKPTHTDSVIHYTSVHPYTHKLAAFRSLVHRLLNVPLSPQNYEKEINIIRQIAYNNGYNPIIIDQLISKFSYKKALKLVYFPTKNSNISYYSLSYIGPPSDKISNQITKFLNSDTMRISFSTNHSLGKYLKNNKDLTDKKEKSGVYLLQCGSCEKAYVGQTGRAFQTRMTDHDRSYTKEDGISNYAAHFLEKQDHSFNLDFKILHTSNKGSKLNALETLEINRRKNGGFLLNNQQDFKNTPLLNLFS